MPLRQVAVESLFLTLIDASSKGLGAVILQEDNPIAYASKALTKTQQNYAKIEKETLAIAFGCSKFHKYIFRREITVESDHKPLQSIFRKPLYQAPPGLQGILLTLQQYDLKVIFKPGVQLTIDDTLSRAYLNETNEELDARVTVNFLEYRQTSISRIPMEWGNHFEFSEVRDSQLCRHTNSCT